MDNTFKDAERLYRAVYPPSHPALFWKKDGSLSPSAFADPKGLSVERGFYRDSAEIVEKMKKILSGCIVSLNVGNCREVNAVVKYKPTNDNDYHSEIHGSDTVPLLNKSQRYHLAEMASTEYMTE